MKKTVAVIGAGAAGLIAAGRLAERGFAVKLIEKNKIPGKKLRITGKGRCNLTNDADISEFFQQIPRNPKFLYSAFYHFTNRDLMELMERLGVALKVERGGRVFPVSDRASDVADALYRYANQKNTQWILDTAVAVCEDNGKVTGVRLQKKGFLPADAVLVATGGISYPQTGSTGDGYRFARACGHSVTPLTASLVPLVTEEKHLPAGLTLKNVSIRLLDSQTRAVYEDFGELLFTHFGLSGPVILSASAHMKEGECYTLSIDLKPALDDKVLDARVLRDFSGLANKDFHNALSGLLPQALIPMAVERSGIPAEKKVNQITREERMSLVHIMKNLEFTILEKRPVREAVITAGGVSTKEIDPSTMESKKVSGLYFAGEVLDVDAYTGGYNLQIAFSTGYLAADQI